MTNYSRSNPVLPATSQNDNTANPSYSQDFSSVDKFFIPHPQADGIDAHDAVNTLLSQAHATVVALSRDGQNLKEGFSFSQEIICNLLWAIQTQLEMAQAAMTHMSEADHASKKDGGDNHV
jgi:hypothetical protein